MFLCAIVFAQQDSLMYRRRSNTLAIASLATAGVSYVALNELWYKNYPRTTIHSFNDNSEWLQVDKCGHVFTSYALTKSLYDIHTWANPTKQHYWKSAATSMLYMTSIELLDGRSSAWGFSWGDMIANASGIFAHASQHFYWNEQRIVFKFSYAPSTFADVNEEQLGRNFQQRVLKDYNAQTYWASFNIHRFLASGADFPRWLNIAIGYGATKMTSAKMTVDDVNNFQSEREFYFSFDADLERVRWKKKWMKRTMKILSFIKIPGPTLEIRDNGKLKLHGLFF
ncbi:MAG: DUF2279 domain-containing protein [Flavobacteriales bacterium]